MNTLTSKEDVLHKVERYGREQFIYMTEELKGDLSFAKECYQEGYGIGYFHQEICYEVDERSNDFEKYLPDDYPLLSVIEKIHTEAEIVDFIILDEIDVYTLEDMKRNKTNWKIAQLCVDKQIENALDYFDIDKSKLKFTHRLVLSDLNPSQLNLYEAIKSYGKLLSDIPDTWTFKNSTITEDQELNESYTQRMRDVTNHFFEKSYMTKASLFRSFRSLRSAANNISSFLKGKRHNPQGCRKLLEFFKYPERCSLINIKGDKSTSLMVENSKFTKVEFDTIRDFKVMRENVYKRVVEGVKIINFVDLDSTNNYINKFNEESFLSLKSQREHFCIFVNYQNRYSEEFFKLLSFKDASPWLSIVVSNSLKTVMVAISQMSYFDAKLERYPDVSFICVSQDRIFKTPCELLNERGRKTILDDSKY